MLTPKQRRRLKSRIVGLSLFLLPLPLLLKATLSLWSDDAANLAATGGSWLLFLAAAILCRRGMQAELMQAERPIGSRRPTTLKTAGGVLVAVATMLTALFAVGHDLPIALAFGLIAALGYFLLYGGEDVASQIQKRNLGLEGDEAGRLLREAYRRLDGIETASRRIASGEFKQRLGNIVVGAEKILRLVADDPGDLRRARKFLTVYLDGAQRVTEEYARTHANAGSAELEHNFRTLLVDMENTCDEQYRKMLEHDVSDLEVRIEVLSARLRQEGVT
jgi:5-bromo-4-chloroindolyl phosphate hydrolysis protein